MHIPPRKTDALRRQSQAGRKKEHRQTESNMPKNEHVQFQHSLLSSRTCTNRDITGTRALNELLLVYLSLLFNLSCQFFTHSCAQIHTHTHTHTHTHASTHTRAYEYTLTCTATNMHIYIGVHTHMHTQTHSVLPDPIALSLVERQRQTGLLPTANNRANQTKNRELVFSSDWLTGVGDSQLHQKRRWKWHICNRR